MDFVKRIIVDGETVITKELLDSFQDGIIEALVKIESLLANPPIYNAQTHDEFPSVGNANTIYKAESEKLLYQWNTNELKYEVLNVGGLPEDIEEEIIIEQLEEAELVGGGGADESSWDTNNLIVIDGGDTDESSWDTDNLVVVSGGGAGDMDG